MQALAQFFMKDKKQDLSCKTLATRDTSFLDDVVETPHLHAAEEKRNVNARAVGYGFSVDDYGRPAYNDGTIGYPLPYYDQYIMAGKYARRCYVHPEVNEITSCRTWLLPTPVASALSVVPLKASYAKAYTATPSITLTAAPSVATVPTSQLLVSGPSMTSNSTAASPTGSIPRASKTPSAGSVSTRVSLRRLLQIMSVSTISTFFFF